MYLVYNKCLVSRSSKSVYFFKMEYDEEIEDRKWVLYREIDIPGFISYTKGNIRMQLVTN